MSEVTLEEFRIYIDRLKDGKTEKLDGSFSTDFLEVKDQELSFSGTVEVTGETYLADDTLVLHFGVKTTTLQPCAICNKACSYTIRVKGHYHAEDTSEIRTGIFDFRNVLRDAILLEVPSVVECQDGKCPDREDIVKYFAKAQDSQKMDASHDAYHPFSDLNIELN
ncbi:MAG: uncharacterized metal-binding protein YceD (DUF177 family) [Chlamydiales bacterium]|jgi:uncharacterized metal-binding protein YceD (DUF177 family)